VRIGAFQIEKITMAKVKEHLRILVMMAPLFLVSNPEMMIQVCKSGIIGSLPALYARTENILEEWISGSDKSIKH